MVGVPEGVPSYIMFWQRIFFALFVPAIILIIILALNLTATESKSQLDKMKPIECGFEDHLKGARTPFSLYFFTLAVLFLVFDVETVLLFPSPIAANIFPDVDLAKRLFFFLLVLLAGLIHEARQGMLSWAKF